MILRPSVVLLMLFLAAPWLCGQGPAGTETLTNSDVVKMVQAHLSADVIIQHIQSNLGNYVLTTNGLIQLKQAGVPDRIMAAMQSKMAEVKKMAERKDAPKQESRETRSDQASPQAVAKNEYAWDVDDVLDKMTGNTTRKAT